MASRAVFVSSCGDPFILCFALKLWKERWYDEVDRVYVNYNNHSQVPQAVVEEVLTKLSQDPKIHVIYHPRGIGNGTPITEMTLLAQEDLVMLMEDDGFIFTRGIVNECFQKIEVDQCDAVGSPRMSCGPEVAEGMARKYTLDYSGLGDKGPNFWPNFFFCKREDLLKTDMNFASKKFGEGEYFKELDHGFRETNYGDTFVWADIQMRFNGVRFAEVPQYHANPFDLQHYEENRGIFDGNARWVHGGSLSSGWNGYLSGNIPDVSHDAALQEIESRVAFWIICSSVVDGFEQFKIQYHIGIDDLITKAPLDKERIRKKVTLYKQLMKI